ncbi:MAG: thioesterase family protein [Propionibacteriales bacterium]|nr:thioesterase family protein [Propionibacteriales bacterium]
MCEQPSPFSTYRTAVRDEWLDYNGHMHDASYATVLSDAHEELFVFLGLSEAYRVTAGAALYTVECHIRYLTECSRGQVLWAATTMVAADARKVRLHTELRHEDGRAAATGEFMYLHVDTALGTTTAMPPDQHERVQDMLLAHAGLPRPPHLGLGVGAGRV